MTFDDLKAALNDLGQSADPAPTTDNPAASLRHSRSALGFLRVVLLLELAQALLALVVLGWFLATHPSSPWTTLGSATLLLVLEFGYLVATMRQFVLLNRVDYADPVTQVQHQLGALMALRSRTVWGVLVAAPLAWLPMLIVAAAWLVGVDLLVVADGIWALANLVLGLAVLGLGWGLAQHPPSWVRRSPGLRRAFDHLAGRSLQRAFQHAEEAAAFAREPDA